MPWHARLVLSTTDELKRHCSGCETGSAELQSVAYSDELVESGANGGEFSADDADELVQSNPRESSGTLTPEPR